MVVHFDRRSVDFVAHAGKNREMRIDAPIVLDISGNVPAAEIKILRSPVLHRSAIRQPQQEIRELVGGTPAPE